MGEPVETSELLAFARTVEAKSVSRAAAELRVPRATISRRLARLERRLHTRLLRRTTRSLALTDAGAALYQHARIVLDAVVHAEASVRRSDDVVRGDLRVSSLPALTRGFRRMFSEFARAHPGVRLQVDFSTHHVDLLRGGYDVAIRSSTDLPPGLVARTLARQKLVAVAAPAYLRAHGTPRTRADLRDHRCLMGFAHGSLPATHWPLPGGGKVHVDGMMFSNDLRLICEAALDGHGIALLPTLVCSDLVARGELVPVLPKLVGSEGKIAIVYPERDYMPPALRAFVDLICDRAPRELAVAIWDRA